MKKLFVGCGILVLILLGLGGYYGYQFTVRMQAANELFAERLGALDQSHPFDPDNVTALDTERFAATLELRVDLRDGYHDEMLVLEERDENGDPPGLFAAMSAGFDLFEKIPEMVISQLEQRGIGPTEFEYHVRLLWAALESVDAGLGDERLAPLKGEYAKLRGTLRADYRDLPALDVVVGSFDPNLISTARDILATDTQRVLDGIADAYVEAFIYPQLSTLTMEDLMQSQSGTPVDALAPPAEDPDEG